MIRVESGTRTTRTKVNKQTAARKSNQVFNPSPKTEVKKRIYLDNNATTPVAEAVQQVMIPYLGAAHGNPSSIYSTGKDARGAMEKARRQVASLLNTSPRRIIFTGGGSEADNLALKGVAFARRNDGNHIIATTIEHPAVLSTAGFLEKQGFRITYLEVDSYGCVEPAKLREAISDDTILVSIMLANNEVGTILPIRELCDIAHEKGVLFHTDAVQAIGKINVDVNRGQRLPAMPAGPQHLHLTSNAARRQPRVPQV